MVIEWAAISGAVTPRIKKYAADRAEKLATKYADGLLAKAYRRIVPDEKLVKTNEAFVLRFSKELDSAMDLPSLNAQPYQDALKVFLSNAYVQDAIQAPLDGDSRLDAEVLRGIWSESRTKDGQHLIELPADFDWLRVATTYHQAIRHEMLTDPELRPVIEAVASLRAAEASERTAAATERLAGPIGAFDLTRYARALKTSNAYLKLSPIDTDWIHYGGRVALENVYVPQSLKQAIPLCDLTRDHLRSSIPVTALHFVNEGGLAYRFPAHEHTEPAKCPLMDVVDDLACQKLVILGDPGLGKSTLLKHLVLRWADNPTRPLALLVELRRAADYENFLDYLEKAPDPTCCLPRMELHNYLQEHQSLALFDGLDEVTEGPRADMVAKIIRFSNDYPRTRILVTTRIHGYHAGSTHPERFRDAGFEHFTLQDFDDAEIDRFIALWHQQAFRDPTDRARYDSRLRRAIHDSAAIRELAANPLLLTMMAILNRTQDLPRDRAKLYERCAELLLKNWDLEKFPQLREKRDTRDINDKLGPDQKMRILEQVAAAMQQERTGVAGNLISEDKLKQIVTRELSELGVPQPWAVAEDLIWMLRERNFMLAYLGGRQYGFIHRTLLEYLCARDLKHRLEKTSTLNTDHLREFFRQNWRDVAWHEVLRLLCAMIGPEYAALCVSELLSFGQQPGGYDAIFLAAECLGEIRELGSVREVRNQTREALLPLVRFSPLYPHASALRLDPRTPVTLQPELIRIPDLAIRLLARGWKDDPETLPWLKGRHLAIADESSAVREAAVQEVARGWKDDPETLPWLKARATKDQDWNVRITAMLEILRNWRDNPGTLPWFKGRAEHDADNILRRWAIQQVARGWKDDPETLPWLKSRALHDKSEHVRMTAMQELAHGWKEDPRVQDFLTKLAESDVRSVTT